MPYKCAKTGIQGQIRLKSGDHYQTHWKENPVILSTPVSDKGIGHTYNEEKQTRGQNAEAERSIIECETVKIRARTPLGFNDSKHIGINWRIILVNETAQKISLPGERSRNPLRFQGNTMRQQTRKTLRATDCMDLKDTKGKYSGSTLVVRENFHPLVLQPFYKRKQNTIQY